MVEMVEMALVLFGLGTALYFGVKMGYPPEVTAFSWHPACMALAFVSLAGNAALIKKKGGYANTKTHGNLMCAAVLLAIGGYYSIYSRKEMLGKPHVTSW